MATAQERMQEVLKENPTVGRVLMARKAGVSKSTAQLFLEKVRRTPTTQPGVNLSSQVPNNNTPRPKEELFERLKEIVSTLGKFPSQRDMSQFGTSERSFCRVFGSWSKAKAEYIAAFGLPEVPAPPVPDVVVDVPQAYRAESEIRELKSRLSVLTEENARLAYTSDILNSFTNERLQPPTWLAGTTSKGDRAIATAFLSDTHFDEVVKPAEVNNVNAYDREIAEIRLEMFFRNTVKLGRDLFNTIKMEGLVLALGGDIVTGNIHDELVQTNAAYILDTCLHWSERICAGIELLLQFYPSIFVPCVVGNHGRLTKKPRHKGRAKDNFDYLIYSLVARHFKDDSRVSFLIPESSDAKWQVYGTHYCMTHGDQFRGGSGIAGALSPLLLGDARKRKREDATGQSYDYLLVAHWHQAIDTNGIIVNNSLKGYDEYAANNNFSFSEPSQAFWLTDPDRGRTLRAPIHVRSKKEDWGAVAKKTEPIPGWLKI